ncbi:MAG: amidohydrolase family protein [Pseudomonadales bacterium]|nr:amidohydrolase family protein [Pseudomonadales bacterium]
MPFSSYRRKWKRNLYNRYIANLKIQDEYILKAISLFTAITLCIGLCACNQETSKSSSASAAREQKATLYFGGDILTMQGDTPSYVEAVVEKNGKIIFVGDKSAADKIAIHAKKVDLQGKTMLPGFLDAHSHFMSAILMVNQINVAAPPVGTAKNIPDIIAKLKTFQQEKSVETAGWIIAWGYDQ